MLIPTKRFDEFKNLAIGELFVLMDTNDMDIWCKTPFADMQEHNNDYCNADGAFCTAVCLTNKTYMQCNPVARVIVVDVDKIKERLGE